VGLQRWRPQHRHASFRSPARAQITLGSSRLDTTQHDSTRLDTFDVSSPCILAVSSLSNSTARHTRHDEIDSLDTPITTSATGVTRNLVCCVICIKLWYVNYSLIYQSIYLFNCISFDVTNRICVCESIKTTKLVEASTIACSSSAMLKRRTCRVVSRHDEPSGIWS